MDYKNILQVNPVMVDRIRLAIMTTLSVNNKEVGFLELLDKLEVTKGNLSSHLRKLEDAGLVKIIKKFVGRKPKTTVIITTTGKKMFESYIETLSNIIKEN